MMNSQFKYILAMLLVGLSLTPLTTAVQAADDPEILTPAPAAGPRINDYPAL